MQEKKQITCFAVVDKFFMRSYSLHHVIDRTKRPET